MYMYIRSHRKLDRPFAIVTYPRCSRAVTTIAVQQSSYYNIYAYQNQILMLNSFLNTGPTNQLVIGLQNH